MIRIQFPNPYGFPLPSPARVQALQQHYGFSSQYADFLQQQNGFSLWKMEEDANNIIYFADETIAGESGVGAFLQDFQVLFGVETGDSYFELEGLLPDMPLPGLLFPIGCDCGGNEFVEVLAGPFTGYIGCLSHESELSHDVLDEWAQASGLDCFAQATPAQQIAVLTQPDIGVLSLLAPSFDVFVTQCIHCNEEFMGAVLNVLE